MGYCLGSIHRTSASMLDFNKRTLAAFANCNVLGLEADLLTASWEDIRAICDAAEQEKIIQGMRANLENAGLFTEGSNAEVFEKGMQLFLDTEHSEDFSRIGIDYYFALQARKRGIETVALESKEIHQSATNLLREQINKNMP